MTSMQPLPERSEEPRRPTGVIIALATGYASGYAAALGVAGSQIDSTASAAVAAVQGVIAAACWVLWQQR
ncbi:hypothetical protein [Streptomyces sp. NBC_00342]|uniref:hypothetical protein n=1 Tax=Streptomyces sp. NBC_00342 TaxID=2975718 RepID=UPI002E2B1ED6|nr:hypothetical protein [Streptomyces sp. NBC_00342]